jgi:hypothetical protein
MMSNIINLDELRLPEGFKIVMPFDDEGWEIYNAEIEQEILEEEWRWDEGI